MYLYHYTSIETLLHLVCSNQNTICFRATHVNYLNDPTEYSLALDLLTESLILFEKERSIASSKSEHIKKHLSALSLTCGEPYLFSLSEQPDSLTMWRTYGFDGKGIAIGLDTNILNDYGKQSYNTSLFKCYYNKERLISELTKYWEELYYDISVDDKSIGMNDCDLLIEVVRFCFSIKAEVYETEKEWRLCKNEFDEKNIKFRVRNGLIVPYIEHHFDKRIIKQIVIGPCLNKEVSKKSIDLLLKANHFKLPNDCEVIVSKVPYVG